MIDLEPRGKVLVVTTSFPNQANQSAGTFVLKLSEKLQKYNSIEVLTPSVYGLENEASVVGDKVMSVIFFRYAPKRYEVLAQLPGGIPAATAKNTLIKLLIPFFILKFMFSLISSLRGVNSVLAHWAVPSFLSVLACALYNKRVVSVLHGEDVRRARVSLVSRAILWVVVRFSSRTICVSEAMLERVRCLFPTAGEKVEFISNGVDESLLRQPITKNSSELPLKLLVVASLVPIKSVDHIIQAVSRLHSEGFLFELTIAGDGPLMHDLKALAEKLGVAEYINFLGVLPQEEIYKLYVSHNALILPSREEGRSSVVMEAMAAGLPVIASNVVGINELLSETQFQLMYRYGSIVDLVKAIRTPVNDLDAIGLLNRQWISTSDLVWDEVARKYAEIL